LRVTADLAFRRVTARIYRCVWSFFIARICDVIVT
jgi:hypothetical protein